MNIRRRSFLASLAGAAALRSQPARSGLRLGIDAYSIRAWGLKAPALVEYAAAQKVDVLQFSGLGEIESLDTAYLARIKDAGAAAGLTFELGLGSICPTSAGYNRKNGAPDVYLSTALKAAKALGAPCVKAYLGSSADRRSAIPIEKHIEETLKTLKSVRALATDLGVKVAMENHSGDLTARELRSLIETAGKDWVGCCLDTGNPALTLEDPVRVLEILGPYTLTSHIRDIAIFEHPQGAVWQWVALGDGCIDWPAFLASYRQLCPSAAFLLENITGRPLRLAPYLEQDFWKAFPAADASDFAAYVAFVKRGKPYMGPMIIADGMPQPPEEYREALKRQQKYDLEKGLAFARTKLGVGLKS